MSMNTKNEWTFPEDCSDLHPIFQAAKLGEAKRAIDGVGVFTVVYEKLGARGSARDYLTRSNSDENSF
jgi:hypothetical protein